MRKSFLALSLICLSFLTGFTDAKPAKKNIYLTQIVEHPALNRTRDGIIDGLAKKGYAVRKIKSANGDITLAIQIAKQFMSDEPDAIIALGTPSAQAFLKTKTPTFFVSVTSPKAAGLTQKPNISGTSNYIPLEPQLEFYKQIYPKLKRLGTIYRLGEANSAVLNEKLTKIAPKMGIQFKAIGIYQSQELLQACKKLCSEVDAILITNDNLALSGFKTIVKIANAHKIPVFVSDTDIVEQGALASYGPNQYELGLKTADLILSYFKTSVMPEIYYPSSGLRVINQKQAKLLDIDIPKDLKIDKTVG